MEVKIKTYDPIWTWCNEKAANILRNFLSYEYVVWERGQFGKKRRIQKRYLIESHGDGNFFFLSGLIPRVLEYLHSHFIEYDYTSEIPELRFNSPHLKNITLRDYQSDLVRKAISAGYGVIKSPTGCVTGDTIINTNRKGNGRSYTIEEMWYGLTTGKKGKGKTKNRIFLWDKRIPTKVRSLDEKRNGIFLQEIEEVIYSGRKKVWELSLENGRKIKATANHKIMTKGGWVELQNLTIEDEVMCDTINTSTGNGTGNTRTKPEKYHCSLWNHPFARKVVDTTRPEGWDKRHPEHILAWEANANKLNLEEYLSILKKRGNNVSCMEFVDTSKFHIHHIDEDPYNNDPANLEKKTAHKHLSDHGYTNGWKNFNQGVPFYSKVESIKYIGVRRTYDICCKDPNHNFVGNGIVVHNSGKSIIMYGVISCFTEEKVLILVHSLDLVQQLYAGLVEMEFEGCGIYTSKKPFMHRITVCTVQTYVNTMSKWVNHWDVVIVDEGHHVSSTYKGNYFDSLTRIKAPWRFAFTATLSDNEEGRLALEGLIGPVVGELTMAEGQELGFLSTPEIIFRVVEIPEDCLVMRKDTAYTKIYDAGIVKNWNRTMRVIADAEEEVENGGTVLILVRRIQHIEEMLEFFSIDVSVVKGEISKEDRSEIRNGINSDKIKCVIATTAWTEGINLPELSMVINAAGGKSERETLQKIGRGLRKTENKNTVKIIDFMDVGQVTKNMIKVGCNTHLLHKQSVTRWKIYKEQGWFPKMDK